MPEKRYPKPIVKQETSCWMGVIENPRGYHAPREPFYDKMRRQSHEKHNTDLTTRFRLDSAYELYTEPLEEVWRGFALKQIPNCAKALEDLFRTTIQLDHNHTINVLDNGDLVAKSEPLGDALPTLFYRTNTMACWRVYRLYHRLPCQRPAEGPESELDGVSIDRHERQEKHHRAQHELVDALHCDGASTMATTYRSFLEHFAKVKAEAILREVEGLGQAAPTHITFQLVVPYKRHFIAPVNAVSESDILRAMRKPAEGYEEYMEALIEEERERQSRDRGKCFWDSDSSRDEKVVCFASYADCVSFESGDTRIKLAQSKKITCKKYGNPKNNNNNSGDLMAEIHRLERTLSECLEDGDSALVISWSCTGLS